MMVGCMSVCMHVCQCVQWRVWEGRRMFTHVRVMSSSNHNDDCEWQR